MRALFFLLVLANLLFYAWHAGYIGPDPVATGESGRLTQEIAPEKIRLVSADQARALTSKTPKPLACLEWGAFPAQDFERAQVLLAAMSPSPRYSARKTDETAGWWVFLPPQANKPAADKKGTELKQLGISDFFVINEDGPNKLAISLGVFKTEEAARNYLETLARRGVKNGRAAERETRVARTILQFREVDDALRARLTDFRKEFSSQDFKDCAAEDRKSDERKG